jgi:hypothetical protein
MHFRPTMGRFCIAAAGPKPELPGVELPPLPALP